jgi:hypothetical protein
MISLFIATFVGNSLDVENSRVLASVMAPYRMVPLATFNFQRTTVIQILDFP